MKNPPNKPKNAVFPSSKSAAGGLGIPETVVRWCREQGCDAFDSHHRVNAAALVSFMGSKLAEAIRAGAFRGDKVEHLDPVQEKAMLDRERRLELEDARKVREGELVNLATVEKLVWEKTLLPLKQAIEIMPEAQATLVNPQNPDHAKKILREWWEKTKQGFREPEKK